MILKGRVQEMRYIQNLHTHTTFCDGKHTPEKMVRFAMEQGFESIGFSGHAPMPYSTYTHITQQTTLDYCREIRRLKKAYAGQLEIYLGLEADMFYTEDMSDYDYLIGSVHYLCLDGNYIGFDRSAETVQGIIDAHFGGDGMAFAKAYYKTLAQLPHYGQFDIIGHFDLITKNIEMIPFFDLGCKEYLDCATEAMDALQGKINLFEVNTGAMARGYRTAPYPTASLLRELKKRGFGAVISSDCHDGQLLAHGFEEAAELLRACGFRERWILTDSGFVPVGL